MLNAYYSRRGMALVGLLVFSAIIAWGVRHLFELLAPERATASNLALVWLVSFLALSWSNILSYFEKVKTTTPEQQKELDKLNVAVLVPVYNEDPALLRECLKSLVNQTRLPNHIYIVDDGSKNLADLNPVKQWAKDHIAPQVKTTWKRTENKGKRNAQAMGIFGTPDADIYLTVDSDTVLDRKALREALKPFADPEVQSVAGVLLAINSDQNFLTRFSGVWETTWQLVDRSGQSVLNCVTVNSGPLALYRAETIRQYMPGYLSETFAGRPVHFSDDSLLTTYAIMHGKTVQQPSAICFSATPDNVSHHIRRYVRWMRGSFIRSFWRFKYLPKSSYVFWLHWFKLAQLFLSIFTFVYLLQAGAFFNPAIIPWLIIIPVAISYSQALKYLTIVRSDQSRLSQLYNFSLAPVATLWQLTVLRAVKWYAYATCLKTGWGTRSTVETTI